MLIDRFGLGEVANSQGRFLSGGERRKLEIAQGDGYQSVADTSG